MSDGWRRWSWKARAGLAAAALAFLAFSALWFLTVPPPLPSYAMAKGRWQPSEAWLYDRDGALIDSLRVNFEARRLDWAPLAQIAPVVRETFVAAEDKRFADHGGVDWLAVFGSLRDRIEGKRARGASTLSMQVAGFLAPDLAAPGARGWRDKARQMRAAMALEEQWSKDEILEAYLNLAGYRGEAQGIGAAALGLFGKTPDALGRTDALLLAALLPDPRAEPRELARRACALGTSDECPALRAGATDMLGPARQLALDPGLAPHLSQKLLTAPGLKLKTTLDMHIQRIAVAALRRQLRGLGSDRARDGAVVVVDNVSGDVLAYVGGVGGASTAAQVDGAGSYRQAGSTLKPFLYAQAIERGYLTPASILDDSPVQLDTASGLYVPQNYDRDFKGPVSVRSALAGSLNVPAVRTLVLTGVDAFRDRLWDAGYRGLTEDGQYYGFSLALGSAEVTLLEQAAAYRALALGGRWAPLRLKPDDPHVAARAVFSPQASWIVADMLADPDARALAFGLDSALRLPFWAAVKTGTSKAMRDNWCVGFSDRYTVAVWIGNLEGDSMRAVSGTSGAAPVWRDVMRALHADRPGKAPPAPPGIERRRIIFADRIEPPRAEYFLAGTGQTLVGAAPATARRPRITSPVAGSVYALDPDIPVAHQRMAVLVAGEVAGHRLVLDRRDLGPADAKPLVLAGPGAHRLLLQDPAGKPVDSLIFTVR
ncbi:penicillin-binding protein 1C [Sphingomonas cavernae]|uniref:peptidoglycan glycosyltransferase n=1 Tax=Sphingomonas cavernae TaxID=2320861 RepID=A0A418W8B2_9SPHN|nr:penicillin-binding protein 1C [Sphingomonas cavernae]RJF86235.1 penicillin-binding protein 1C [Sphingomonas cavernae]